MAGWDGSVPQPSRCSVHAQNCRGRNRERSHERDLEINRGSSTIRACSNPLCQLKALEKVQEEVQKEGQEAGERFEGAARSVS